ncbi:MAG TPA: glycosyltransferase [Anaerolineales bacterium]|nr:glycosyltransferase [Anaerolineales bacterium]
MLDLNMSIKVLVAYHYFAHYRLPILQELSVDKEITYTFISGTTTDTDIKVITPIVMAENQIHWKKVLNIWFLKRKILWQVGLIRECVAGDYDVIIFLGSPYFLSTWFAIILSRLFGKTTFLWMHGILRQGRSDMVKIIFYRLANALLLYNHSVKPDLQRHGLSDEKLFTVYNSLDYRMQLSLRKQLQRRSLSSKKRELFTHPGNPVIVFIGRLTAKKKLDELIAACAKLHQNGLPVNLLIIGEGMEKEKLILLAREKQLQEYAVFFGESYDEKVLATLIALADICVSPGNVGLTCIHALTYGTPVITHDNPLEQMPEFEAISDGETGMFFHQGSISSLAETITKWLNINRDHREAIRNRCYQIIDEYYNPIFQAQAIKDAILQQYSSHKRVNER